MGLAGSFRANALDAASLKAMENHGKRLDRAGELRRIREVDALIYDPYLCGLDVTKSHAAHVEGKRQNSGASKIALHAFIQFPTQLEITPENEQMMLDQAVAFVNKTHGGSAVFHARLDRDEAGKHGVDVFYSPTYDKTTKRGTEAWVSLSKFGRDLARERLGQKQAEKLNPKTAKWEPQLDKDGNPKMVWQDSSFFVGRVMQDEWFEHLRDEVGLSWVERGEQKVGRDPDRVEVEEYKVRKEAEKLGALQAQTAAAQKELPALREQIAEAATDLEAAQAKATKNERLAEKARAKAEADESRAAKNERLAETYERRAEEAHRAAESATERVEALRSTEATLRASVERLEAREASLTASVGEKRAELSEVETSVAQKKTKMASLESSNGSLRQKAETLRAKLQTLNAA